MEKKIIKFRWWIIVLSVIVTLGLSLSLTGLEIDPDLRNYFPKTMTSMINTDQIEEVFGNQDLVMVVFETDDVLDEETLRRVKEVERDIGRFDGVRKTLSLFGSNRIYGEQGIMYVEPVIERIPRTNREREELRDLIRDNDLVREVVVSKDFSATAVVITLAKGVDEEVFFSQVESILSEHPGDETIHFGGLPYIREAINKDIVRDGLVLIPLALVIMLIFLYVVFREWRGVWLPFLVVVMSALLGVSLIPLFGWKFTLITLLVPILLIAVANDYGIHMIAKYQELNASGNGHTMKQISGMITKSLWRPILLTGLTTIAGISALLAHTLIPARQMAVIAGIGIALAIFFSLVLLPALLSTLKRSAPLPHLQKQPAGEKNHFLDRFAAFVVRRSKVIPYGALIITLAMATGIFFLRVDSNEENFFPEKHEVKQAARIINNQFGGSENISVMFSGDMLDPDVLKRMEHYRQDLEKMEEIDLTMSFSGVVREISKALNDPGDKWYDAIPPTRDAVAQYMELYSMSGNPEDMEQLVDFNYENAHLMIRINDVTNESVNSIIDRLESYADEDPSIAAIGGYGYVRSQLANKVLLGQYYSLGIALLIIFILVSVIFRSPAAGLLGITPLAISVVVLFGLMGLTGIRLDVATALLSSLMIGVGVDYTIHFLWRYREERQKRLSPAKAVQKTMTTTGRGIIFNALSVIVGFSVLVISSFTPIRFFGVLVVVSVLSCLTGALVILPALLLRIRFRFLEPAEEPVDRKMDERLKEAG
ncbi:MAG: MMPL family transporter [Bacteroidales bacterium]